MIAEIIEKRIGFLKLNMKPSALRLDMSEVARDTLQAELHLDAMRIETGAKYLGMRINIVRREGWEICEDAGNLR